MGILKAKNKYIIIKNWISDRLSDISLSTRFIVLFIAACSLGIWMESSVNLNYSSTNIIDNYFLSFNCNNLADFIKNVCISSSFEFFAILTAIVSAFTFFCSAFLHSSCVVCGSIYGICIGFLTSENVQCRSFFILTYIFSVAAFAILYSISASFVLRANKQFISAKRNNETFSKIFVSPIFKQYLLKCFRVMAFFLIVRILYVSVLYIGHII